MTDELLPRVEFLVEIYDDNFELKDKFLGKWKSVPLAFGDGCCITTESGDLIVQFSDYKTAQYLVKLHNSSFK